MGSGRFSSATYGAYRASTESFTREQRFKETQVKKELDPRGVKIRESRDSKDNPQSNAVIVALDVTGSMGFIAEDIAKNQLGVLFNDIFDLKPITDPHLMFMAVGDVHYDNAPLQVSQFEADNRIVEQLTGIYLEGGGGGNKSESYQLPWLFAGLHTSIDCFEKRGRKGYLFTVGDEEAPDDLSPEDVHKVFGSTPQRSYTAQELYALASKMYHVYHIIIEQGNYAKHELPAVRQSWQALMGQNALSLSDYTKLAQAIVAVIDQNEQGAGRGTMTAPVALPPYLSLAA